ncbi:hypothetical protein QQ045_010388 [Rhodiola kirilowii]
MEAHLYKYDFTPNYFNWTLHGEDLNEDITVQDTEKVLHRTNEMREGKCFTCRLYRVYRDFFYLKVWQKKCLGTLHPKQTCIAWYTLRTENLGSNLIGVILTLHRMHVT